MERTCLKCLVTALAAAAALQGVLLALVTEPEAARLLLAVLQRALGALPPGL